MTDESPIPYSFSVHKSTASLYADGEYMHAEEGGKNEDAPAPDTAPSLATVRVMQLQVLLLLEEWVRAKAHVLVYASLYAIGRYVEFSLLVLSVIFIYLLLLVLYVCEEIIVVATAILVCILA